jgi:hypothetical protein
MKTLQERLRDRHVCSLAQNSCRNDWVCEEAANAIDDLVEALKRIANIENGPDNGSAQWRASASASIASEALAKCKAQEQGDE